MQQHIIIVSGGRLGSVDFFRAKLSEAGDRLLICCDGGARHLAAAQVLPDVVVGDMDSLSPEQLADYERRHVQILRYPTDKDFTDTALALNHAMDLRPSSIEIWGALGGRVDHVLANIYLLMRARQAGIPARLVDDFGEIFIAGDKTQLVEAVGCTVSLVALSGDVRGITLDGFQYPLTRENLSPPESRGISNVIIASPASIQVESGDLLVIRYWQKDVFPEAD